MKKNQTNDDLRAESSVDHSKVLKRADVEEVVFRGGTGTIHTTISTW